MDLPGDRLRVVPVGDSADLADDRDDGQVRRRRRVGEAATLQTGHLQGGGFLAQLRDEPGLPDPCLADDSHDLAHALHGRAQSRAEPAELFAASHEGRDAAAHAESAVLRAGERVHAASALRQLADGRDLEAALERHGGRGAGDDVTGRRGAQEHAQRTERLASALGIDRDHGADHAHGALPDVDGDPHHAGRSVAPDALRGPPQRERGERSAPGSLLGTVATEDGENVVVAELLDVAAEGGELVRGDPEKPADAGRLDTDRRQATRLPANHRGWHAGSARGRTDLGGLRAEHTWCVGRTLAP